MATAFEEDKDVSGARSSVFDDLDPQHRIATPAQAAAPPQGAAAPSGGGFVNALKGYAQTADDAVRAAADAMTFGLLDRGLQASGLEPGAVERTLQSRERSPYASIVGDIGGNVAMMGATPLKAIGTGLSATAGGARAGLGGIAGRAAGYAGEGAILGAGQAAGHTYDLESLPGNVGQGALMGGIVGGATGPFVPRSAVAPRARAEVPTPPELSAVTDAGYTAGRANPHGTFYSGPAVRSEFDNTKQALYAKGYNEENAKETFFALDLAARAEQQAAKQGGTATFSPGNLESIRQMLNKAKTDSDIGAAKIAKQYLDDFTANPTFGTLSAGTPRGARATDEIFQTARGNAAANIRSGILRDAEREVDLRSASRNSGGNYENNMRAAITRVLLNEGRGFSKGEQARLEELARRTDAWNYARDVGNMLGRGGGLGNIVAGGLAGGTGYAASGDVGTGVAAAAGTMLAGRGLRALSNRSMKRGVNEMDEIIRSRSPEFEARQAATPGNVMGPGMDPRFSGLRNAIIDTLVHRELDNPNRLKITVHPRQPGY